MRIRFYNYFVFIGYPRRRCSRTPSTACSSFPASLRLNRSRNRAVGPIVRLICPPKEGSFKPRSWGRFVLPLLSIVRGRVGGCSCQHGCPSRGDGPAEMASEKLPAKKNLVMWFVSFLTLVELELPPIATQETHAGLYSHSTSITPASGNTHR